MDSLFQVLVGILEFDLPSVRQLADSSTWNGPRADSVRQDLHRLHHILLDAVERTRQHDSTLGSPWAR